MGQVKIPPPWADHIQSQNCNVDALLYEGQVPEKAQRLTLSYPKLLGNEDDVMVKITQKSKSHL